MNRPITISPRAQRIIIAVAAILAALWLVAACGNKFTQPFQDAPRANPTNTAPAQIIEMPDGFNNLATKCDHGYRIWVSYHGDGGYGFGFAQPDAGCRKALTAAEVRTTAAVASRRCGSQNLRVTHTSTTATLTVISGLCNRKYQVWASFAFGPSLRGPWVTTGHSSTVYYAGGGNRIGGWIRITPAGFRTNHTSYG